MIPNTQEYIDITHNKFCANLPQSKGILIDKSKDRVEIPKMFQFDKSDKDVQLHHMSIYMKP